MHSDGLSGASWSLDRYPGCSLVIPPWSPPCCYRDFARARRRHRAGGPREAGRGHEPLADAGAASRARRGRRRAARPADRGAPRLRGQDQTRIATAVSEIARNAFKYAGGGRRRVPRRGRDAPAAPPRHGDRRGPGHPHLDGDPRRAAIDRQTGMGLGIVGARRLMDRFDVETAPGQGTTVRLRRSCRAAALVTAATRSAPGRELARPTRADPLEEVQQQNQELLRALDELTHRQDDLAGLNRELEDTNRGVVALYAELDEKADHLRRADELKSRFLSNMSHEFRTPLNSILGLTRLLLTASTAPLTAEQEKQVSLHPQGRAGPLGARQRPARPGQGRGGQDRDAPGGVRGRRPVRRAPRHAAAAPRERVRAARVRGRRAGPPPVHGRGQGVADPAQLHLERAQVHRSAARSASARPGRVEGRPCVFASPTPGIGIAPEDQERIFEEFAQVDQPAAAAREGHGAGPPAVAPARAAPWRRRVRGERAPRRLHVPGHHSPGLRDGRRGPGRARAHLPARP